MRRLPNRFNLLQRSSRRFLPNPCTIGRHDPGSGCTVALSATASARRLPIALMRTFPCPPTVTPRRVRPDGRSWALRQEKQEKACATRFLHMRQEMKALAHEHDRYRQELADTAVALVQGRVERACAAWCGSHRCPHQDCPGPEGLVRESTSVSYIGILGGGTLQIPTYTCGACGTSFTPPAIQSGCFASFPVDAHAWYELHVHESYALLGLSDGLSMTGRCERPRGAAFTS